MKPVHAWGRLSDDLHDVTVLDHPDHVASHLQQHTKGLPFGNGRSYGDVCLNPNGTLWHTVGLNKLIAFDDNTGRLVCEAGVLLRDIQRVFVPRGWMLAVTPGTQWVTVGGAIANDIHGKNHHAQGTFGDHVLGLTLARTDGQVLQCDWQHTPEMMRATVGGLGLTGVVVTASLQLRQVSSPWLHTETLPFEGVSAFCDLADRSESDWEHTVAWIDCLSGPDVRGLFMRGNHLSAEEAAQSPDHARHLAAQQRRQQRAPLSMPFVPPMSCVNSLTLKPFNWLYYQMHKRRKGVDLVHYEPFFYPLDHVQHWNRMYGPNGFYQYQSVVPRDVAIDAVQAMLDAIARSGEGSFLAVLKTFGERTARGMLSFPMPGITLALDFTNRGAATLQLFERLDAIVREANGRLYAAKDARMPRELFEAGYPHHTTFATLRDPGISSAMSRRLMEY